MNREETLVRRRKKLLAELSRLQLLLRGSISERYSICVRPQCDCHKGKKHGPRSYFIFGKVQAYIRNDQVKVTRAGVKQYQRAMKILEELTKINFDLLGRGKLGEKTGEDSP